jgi:putative transport protein
MELDLVKLLNDHPELVLFVLLALAYLIGRLKIGNLELSAPPGMLIAGLIMGHLGFKIFPGIETVGLFLFLYSVAFQAGPAFFSVVLSDGFNYISLAAIATFIGYLLTYGFHLVFNFAPGVPVGLFTGSLTTPAGLAAAIETIQGNDISLATGWTRERILQNVSVTYALTFLVADIAVILLSRNLPRWFRFDLKAESIKAAQEKHVQEGSNSAPLDWALTLRAYEVKNSEILDKSIDELEQHTQCTVLSMKRDGLIREVEPDTRLQVKDRLSIWGRVEQQDLLDKLFGAEVADADLLALKIANRDIIVNRPNVVGKSLQDLGITQRYDCYPVRITRAGIELAINPNLELAQGDVLTLSGPQTQLDKLADEIGFFERNVDATDLLSFSLGIIAGFLIGQVSINIGGIQLGLGTSGGLLLSGILLGYLRSIHPTFGRVPPATLWVFKELGLLLFLAGIGIKAGQGLVQALQSPGPIVFLCAFVVSTLPVIVAFLIGRYYFKLNPALLLGAVTGAVTCTPAMAAVSDDAKSAIPTIGYAGTYAFATVFCAIVASLMAGL